MTSITPNRKASIALVKASNCTTPRRDLPLPTSSGYEVVALLASVALLHSSSSACHCSESAHARVSAPSFGRKWRERNDVETHLLREQSIRHLGDRDSGLTPRMPGAGRRGSIEVDTFVPCRRRHPVCVRLRRSGLNVRQVPGKRGKRTNQLLRMDRLTASIEEKESAAER